VLEETTVSHFWACRLHGNSFDLVARVPPMPKADWLIPNNGHRHLLAYEYRILNQSISAEQAKTEPTWIGLGGS
jgi:hypothetical protein